MGYIDNRCTVLLKRNRGGEKIIWWIGFAYPYTAQSTSENRKGNCVFRGCISSKFSSRFARQNRFRKKMWHRFPRHRFPRHRFFGAAPFWKSGDAEIGAAGIGATFFCGTDFAILFFSVFGTDFLHQKKICALRALIFPLQAISEKLFFAIEASQKNFGVFPLENHFFPLEYYLFPLIW